MKEQLPKELRRYLCSLEPPSIAGCRLDLEMIVPSGRATSRSYATGDEVVHVLLDAMYAKAPYTVIQRAMHIHPTVAEYLPTVLSKLKPFE